MTNTSAYNEQPKSISLFKHENGCFALYIQGTRTLWISLTEVAHFLDACGVWYFDDQYCDDVIPQAPPLSSITFHH